MKPQSLIVAILISLLSTGAAAEPGSFSAKRPYEAPLLAGEAIPPLPPEYLSDDKAGMSFSYHPSARDRVRGLLDEAEEVRADLSQTLGQAVLASVLVRVARGGADFERIVPPKAPRGSNVIVFSEKSTLIVSLRAGPSSADDVSAAFRRGMSLLALEEVAGGEGLPRWFRVGFAEAFARRESLGRARSLWWASMQQRLLPLVDLDHHMGARAKPGTVAVAQAADFVRFLIEEDPGEAFGRLLASVREGQAFDQALHEAYQSDAAALEHAWRQDLAKHKAFVPILAGGTGTWLALALFVRLRRRARQRRDKDAEERESSNKKVSVATLAQAKRNKKRKPTQQLPEPDVPKVSHNGRWHTLH